MKGIVPLARLPARHGRPGRAASYDRDVADQRPTELPIFELPLVLLPGERIPLHIFEERYKRMIAHCLEGGTAFGIVLRDDDGARAIGCSATVETVLERFEDGRLNIVVMGAEAFRVLDRHETPDFPAASVEQLETPEADVAQDASAGAREAFAELLELVEETVEDQPADSYGIAGRVELPVATKQELLEERDETERMRLVEAALRELIETVHRSRKMSARASTNGHGAIG
jgi:Lon protease-like protein